MLPLTCFFSLLLLISFHSQVFAKLDLQNNQDSYTIENKYYKAVIPKRKASGARGIIKHLYVKKENNTWSNDLVYQDSKAYGLGYLEGGNDSGKNNNSSYGLQNSTSIDINVALDSSSEVDIVSNLNGKSTDFSETWRFFDNLPYFESIGETEAKENILVNQFQFAWMVNSQLPLKWYGTNSNGDVEEYKSRKFQSIDSDKLNTYPWINWLFPNEDVSLGLIFTDISNKYGTIGETGDFPFEYQLDFDLGSGSLGNPLKSGYYRKVSTTYFTNSSASNDSITDFAKQTYQNRKKYLTVNPQFTASAYTIDSYGQNLGISSALVNSPYFLVRQNSQNMANHQKEGCTSLTSIYAPLYKSWIANQENLYDFKEQIQYSVNYTENKKVHSYGDIQSASNFNSDFDVYLINNGLSDDKKLAYETKFLTWNNSDKLEISGEIKNNTRKISLSYLYISLRIPYAVESNAKIVALGNNTFDIQFEDEIQNKFGIAVRTLSDFNSIDLKSDALLLYIYKNNTSKIYSSIDSKFDLVIYPHKDWFNSFESFSDLHTKTLLTYYKTIDSATPRIKSNMKNNISLGGDITYTQVNDKKVSSVNLFALPFKNNIDIQVKRWDYSFFRFKSWKEESIKGNTVAYTIGDLQEGVSYAVYKDKTFFTSLVADKQGEIYFSSNSENDFTIFRVIPEISKSNLLHLLRRIKGIYYFAFIVSFVGICIFTIVLVLRTKKFLKK